MTKQTFTTGQVLTAAQMTSLQQTAMGGGSTTAKTASYTLVALDAGTVVQMNSASATTITVNTALFAAGDTVQIQNVGSGVCTVTAGTATVSTSSTLALKQYDAGQLYFNTTSAAFFFAVDAADTPLTTTGDIIYSSSGSTAARLGIGSTGQVLTVASGLPAWATSGAGPTGAWTAYTPTVTAGTGSLTTVSATGYYYATGKLCIVRAHINLTNNGTGSGVLNCTMPFTAINDKNQVGNFREQVVTGKQGTVNLTLNTATAGLRYYDNTYPGANATEFALSITYEVA